MAISLASVHFAGLPAIFNASSPAPSTLPKTRETPAKLLKHNLTADELSVTKTKIDEFIHSVKVHPERREGAYPYYLLHQPGEQVYGTVLFFHGFTSKPDQMWRLAQYLYDNSFNVYQPSLAGQYLVNPDKNWPQVDLKPQWKEPIRKKLLADPILSQALNNVDSASNATREQIEFIYQRILSLSPDEQALIAAIHSGDYSDDFYRFYDSSHMRYITEAETRLQEVEALPGPTFTLGLSVGGAVALGLAAANPDRVAKAVAYAPLLKEVNGPKRELSLIAGPLDVKESGWDPKLQFTLGCFAAADVLGDHVMQEANLNNIARIPTFMMLTGNDDSADIPTNQQVNSRLKELSGQSGIPHLSGMYSISERVPHPMVDPTEVSQGMTNWYWANLYQETFRFLLEDTIVEANLHSQDQDGNLPKVPPV